MNYYITILIKKRKGKQHKYWNILWPLANIQFILHSFVLLCLIILRFFFLCPQRALITFVCIALGENKTNTIKHEKFPFSPPLYSCLDVKGTYTHSSSCNNAQILSQKLWHMFKEGGEEKKKVGFVTLSRRVNTVPGQIYRGYLWSSWNEPMGLKDRTQRSV